MPKKLTTIVRGGQDQQDTTKVERGTNLCIEKAVRPSALPYVESVEVGRHVGRIGAREGVLLADRDLPGIGRLQAVSGVVCVENSSYHHTVETVYKVSIP